MPGYSPDDNLWDFVCDLNSKDPNDDFLDKTINDNNNNVDMNKEQIYTGIRHLLRKKNKTKEKLK